MLGEAALAETAVSESTGAPFLIIPEVGVETKELVFVVELDLIWTGGASAPMPTPPLSPLKVNADSFTVIEST